MKSTGIIRKIDELGRIVIPKEIRANLKIKDESNLEIFIENDQIVLKKYSKIVNTSSYIKKILSLIENKIDSKLMVTDKEKIIAEINFNYNLVGNNISNNIIKLLNDRKIIINDNKETLNITNDLVYKCYYLIIPFITNNDLIGGLICVSDEKISKEMIILYNFISSLITSNIEI